MPDAIWARHIAPWLIRTSHLYHLVLDCILILSECKEDGTYICGLDICQFGSIKFFLGEGVLVSLDPVLLVVLDGGKSNDALLGVVAHGLLVDV